MCAAGYHARDLAQVELHGFSIGIGHGETGPCAARRTDCSEQIGAVVALISRLARARTAPCPLPHPPVLLADAGLVLKPDLHGLAFGHASQVGAQRGEEVFLKAATVCPSCAGWR